LSSLLSIHLQTIIKNFVIVASEKTHPKQIRVGGGKVRREETTKKIFLGPRKSIDFSRIIPCLAMETTTNFLLDVNIIPKNVY
jgi:hypothetical protein